MKDFRLTLEFPHPAEAVIVLDALIESYEGITSKFSEAGVNAPAEYLATRLDRLRVCRQEAFLSLVAGEVLHPPGHA